MIGLTKSVKEKSIISFFEKKKSLFGSGVPTISMCLFPRFDTYKTGLHTGSQQWRSGDSRSVYPQCRVLPSQGGK